ncbi:MAG: hypothetical protein HY907_09295 [Deltaproteobacteria bacterium]|nr:hypothetical protein [Deltaproteobacteria bacterium]
MPAPTTIRQLRQVLEEQRRNTLGLLKAVDALPASLRQRVRMAQDVGASIVDMDEIYEGHPRRRRR